MKILLTGGAGFIGSNLADKLIDIYDEVVVVDDLSTGFSKNLPSEVTFIKMDIRSPEINSVFEQYKFEHMAHLAAQMDVRKSVEDPVFDVDVNVRGLLNLMETGRRNGLQKVVFSSTGGAGYDNEVPIPTPETAPTRPISPYGIAKITSELYLRYYQKQYGIDYTALRFGNVYGPRQNPDGEAGVIAIFTKRMLENKAVWINGDGLQTRDYVFVYDVVDAFVTALKNDENTSFNIGTMIETSVVDLFQMVKKVTGSNIEQTHREAMPGEVRRSCLDPSLIGDVLGWKPEVNLEEGLTLTADFFKRQIEDPNAR